MLWTLAGMVAYASLAGAGLGAPVSEHLSDSQAVCRPVSTYSIVARDPATGELGVAVQSHWFSVGSVVPWAESGDVAIEHGDFAAAGRTSTDATLPRAVFTAWSLAHTSPGRDDG